MPELANPASLLAMILNEQRSSKSPGCPLVQTRNVFSFAGFFGVVCPRIAPSLTDQRSLEPSQPAKSLPLNMLVNPSSAIRPPGCAASRSNPAIINAFFIIGSATQSLAEKLQAFDGDFVAGRFDAPPDGRGPRNHFDI